jgi:hypothetical protein
VVLAVAALGCHSSPPTEPEAPRVSFRSGGGGGGGGASPTVTSTSPSEAPQDITLDVTVFGTNFTVGAKASWLLDGKGTTKIKTNSTTFVSSTELVANITIEFDAVPDLYDVQVVTTNGKKGIGIELFAVTGQLAELASRPGGTAPAGLYQDGLGTYDRGTIGDGINDPGNFNIQAACARGRSFDLVLPTQWQGLLPGATFIAACSGPPGGPATFVQLHFPGLAVADCAAGSSCPIGGPHDPADGSNYAADIFYYFTVDSDGDGRWGPPKDDAYNVIWSDARFSVLRRAPDGTPCQWHIIGGTANLWQRPATPLDANRAVVLDVIVTRTDGICA